jgi:hypothetical protein
MIIFVVSPGARTVAGQVTPPELLELELELVALELLAPELVALELLAPELELVAPELLALELLDAEATAPELLEPDELPLELPELDVVTPELLELAVRPLEPPAPPTPPCAPLLVACWPHAASQSGQTARVNHPTANALGSSALIAQPSTREERTLPVPW